MEEHIFTIRSSKIVRDPRISINLITCDLATLATGLVSGHLIHALGDVAQVVAYMLQRKASQSSGHKLNQERHDSDAPPQLHFGLRHAMDLICCITPGESHSVTSRIANSLSPYLYYVSAPTGRALFGPTAGSMMTGSTHVASVHKSDCCKIHMHGYLVRYALQLSLSDLACHHWHKLSSMEDVMEMASHLIAVAGACLLYTSDAADDTPC
eukprot:3938260-Amphidinium_carterae.1